MSRTAARPIDHYYAQHTTVTLTVLLVAVAGYDHSNQRCMSLSCFAVLWGIKHGVALQAS